MLIDSAIQNFFFFSFLFFIYSKSLKGEIKQTDNAEIENYENIKYSISKYQKNINKNSDISEKENEFSKLQSEKNITELKLAELLATEYLFDNEKRNITKAIETLKKLSSHGSSKSQTLLGYCYNNGIGVPINRQKAFIYYNLASMNGDDVAHMILASFNPNEINQKENCEVRVNLYKKVADQIIKNATSVLNSSFQVQSLLKSSKSEKISKNDILHYYQYQADRGVVFFQALLGRLFYKGEQGVRIDFLKAYKYLKKAYNQGSDLVSGYLGDLYFYGLGVNQNHTIALDYYKKSANENNPVGLTGLGLMFLHGIAMKQNITLAKEMFENAAKQGYTPANYHLGSMVYNGLGSQINYQKAFTYFKDSIQTSFSQYSIALLLKEGKGVMESCETSSAIFKILCERNFWIEFSEEAYQSFQKKDYSSAVLKYMLLSEMGNEIATYNAAYILEYDYKTLFSVKQKASLAFEYWKRAAKQENLEAILKIGDYYYYGNKEVKSNYELAASFYQKAAIKNAQALYNLGYLYEHGIGVQKDISSALVLYNLAIEVDHKAKFILMIPKLIVNLKLFHLSLKTLLFSLFPNSKSKFPYQHSSSSDNLQTSAIKKNEFDYLWISFLLFVTIILIGIRKMIHQQNS